jgi:hypothetical protein
MKVEAGLFLKLRELEFKHLVVTNTLIAGFKVKHKIGGPVMLVQGFVRTVPHGYYFTDHSIRYKNGSFDYGVPIYPKIQLNTNGLTQAEIYGDRTDKRNPGTDPMVSTYFFYKNILDFQVDDIDDNLFVVCKYWSDTKNDFERRIENLYELEVILE